MGQRIKIVILFSLTYFFYYLCRYNYPVAFPLLKLEFGYSATQLGLIATALTAGYALGQFVNGALVDRYGPRFMMTLGGVGIVLAGIVMSASSWLALFILAWFVNGYFQAMGYPSTLRFIANWFGSGEQGKPLGISEFFQSLASIVILPLAGLLAVTYSWREVFSIPAILIGLEISWFGFTATDTPSGKQTRAKLSILDGYSTALHSPGLLLASLSYGFVQFARYGVITWIPSYFVAQGYGILQAAMGGVLFQVGGALGSLLVGWLADLAPRQRTLMAGVGMAFSGLAVATVSWMAPGLVVLVALFLAGVGIEALEVFYFLVPVDALGAELAGTGVGFMNAIGKLTASFQGVVLGFLIDRSGFGSAFLLIALLSWVAAVLIVLAGKNVQVRVSSLSD